MDCSSVTLMHHCMSTAAVRSFENRWSATCITPQIAIIAPCGVIVLSERNDALCVFSPMLWILFAQAPLTGSEAPLFCGPSNPRSPAVAPRPRCYVLRLASEYFELC